MHRYIPGAACWWPMAPKPPVHRRSSTRCTSRCWRLPYIPAEQDWQRSHAHDSRRPYHQQPMAVVSKCALRRGPTKRTERPGHPQTLPLRFPPADQSRPSNLCHSATNKPQSMQYNGLVKPPFIHYISHGKGNQLCEGEPLHCLDTGTGIQIGASLPLLFPAPLCLGLRRPPGRIHPQPASHPGWGRSGHRCQNY